MTGSVRKLQTAGRQTACKRTILTLFLTHVLSHHVRARCFCRFDLSPLSFSLCLFSARFPPSWVLDRQKQTRRSKIVVKRNFSEKAALMFGSVWTVSYKSGIIYITHKDWLWARLELLMCLRRTANPNLRIYRLISLAGCQLSDAELSSSRSWRCHRVSDTKRHRCSAASYFIVRWFVTFKIS